MKNKIYQIISILGIAGSLLISCEKKINDAYLNPNASVVEPIESILPGVIGGFAAFYSANGNGYGVQRDGTLLGRYIQYWGSQSDQDNYGMMGGVSGTDDLGFLWATVYYGQGQNVNKIIQWGTEQEKWDYVGVAWAIRAWGWLELTNQYGDAILQQAFNTSLQQFLYDTQPEFYDSTRAICFRALSYLNRTDGGVSQENLAKGDAFFYNGDVNKWKKFVYGILARSYNDLSNKGIYQSNNYGDSVIKYCDLAMTTNDDNAVVKFKGGSTPGVNNFYGPVNNQIGTIRQGAYIADLMSGRIDNAFTGVMDPRAPYMLRENLNGEFRGFVPWMGSSGLSTNDYPFNFWGNTSSPTATTSPNVDNSRYVFQNTGPWPMMTASEMQFIKAEAALRNGDNVVALAAYKNGISLNFDMLTVNYNTNVPESMQITSASKMAYLSNPLVVPVNDKDLTLSHIMLQKYIALFGWGVNETWTDMRKYHYTDVDPTTGRQVYTGFTPPSGNNLAPNNFGKLVYRCRPRYNSEYLYNVPELTRIGALKLDYNTNEMWFSQK